jgi:purine-nucleoside phosphorylase
LNLKKRIETAQKVLTAKLQVEPEIALILGTGLGMLSDQIESPEIVPYESLPGFPVSTVDSHAGEIIYGSLAGRRVIAFNGRFHRYEGYSMQELCFPVWFAKALGAHSLIVSNAAGGLNPQFSAGDLMVITDHINLMIDNPLIGKNDDTLGPRFPDMSAPYTPALIDLAEKAALEEKIKLRRGVYLGCVGPCLETRAEYRFMRIIGADAVGMSTVPEVIAAVHAGLKVLGFSVITDECFPDALQPADINKIIETANASEPLLTRIVMRCVAGL